MERKKPPYFFAVKKLTDAFSMDGKWDFGMRYRIFRGYEIRIKIILSSIDIWKYSLHMASCKIEIINNLRCFVVFTEKQGWSKNQ